MPTSAKNFFTPEQQADILKAVQQAELNTSGEIRVHIENNCPGDAIERSVYLFKKLGMEKTEQRNGVLFYLAIGHHKFAVIGDTGIDAVVPETFWDDVKNLMFEDFQDGHFTEGLIKAIALAGNHLKERFPRQLDNKNELPDDVSFGDN